MSQQFDKQNYESNDVKLDHFPPRSGEHQNGKKQNINC